MADTTNQDSRTMMKYRWWMALIIIAISNLVLLTVTIVLMKTDREEGGKTAFNMLVPMVGTWIGTVIAYFFSSDNFQRASDSMNKMMGQVIQDKLTSIKVKDVMIARANMTAVVLQPDDDGAKVNLKTEILDRFNDTVTRMPVFTDKDVTKYIIHSNEVFQFVTAKTLAQTATAPFDVSKPTLKEFLDTNKNADFVSKTIAYIALDATLADAKAKMDAIPDCQDVIITDTGDADKPVRGWLTNIQIIKKMRA